MFEAKHVVRSHTIEIQARPDAVFPLFTPMGEKKWVDGWDPIMHYPRSGEAMEGAVFSTRSEGEAETVWAIVEYDPEKGAPSICASHPGRELRWWKYNAQRRLAGRPGHA